MTTPTRTLLIVAAHSDIRQGLAQRFARGATGWTVSTAGDVASGLLLMQELRPHAVLVEIKTANEEAILMVQTLARGGCPIVVLASSLLEPEAARLRHAGATRVLLKEKGISGILAGIETVSPRFAEQSMDREDNLAPMPPL